MNEPWWMHPAYAQPGLAMDQNTINRKNYEMFRNMERSAFAPMQTSPFKVTSPFHRYADSWMRNPAIGSRIEGFDPDQSYGYVDPRRMDALRQRGGGRFG